MDKIDAQKIVDAHESFVNERNWDQYHSIKNLAMALSVEASELTEIFQWLTEEESNQIEKNHAKKQQVEEEIADIMLYLLRICKKLNIDINDAVEAKMLKNISKYPAEQVRSSSRKYTEYNK